MKVAIVFALLGCCSEAAAGAWAQPEGTGFFINDIGYAASSEPYRIVSNGYGETGLGGPFTAVMSFDSTVVPEFGQTVWHATLGVRYTLVLDALEGWSFGFQPIVGYQFHQSPILDPAFAGDGWSYGGRLDVGRGFDAWGLHGFTDLGISATTRSQADGLLKLDFAAGVDFDEHWQMGVGYFADWAPGTRADYGAYQKHEVGAYLRWRFEPDHAIGLQLDQTIWADRTAQETTFRIAFWTYLIPDEEDGAEE